MFICTTNLDLSVIDIWVAAARYENLTAITILHLAYSLAKLTNNYARVLIWHSYIRVRPRIRISLISVLPEVTLKLRWAPLPHKLLLLVPRETEPILHSATVSDFLFTVLLNDRLDFLELLFRSFDEHVTLARIALALHSGYLYL